MTKFNRPATRAKIDSPVTTTSETTTYEGGRAWTRDPRSELVLLATVNMVGEQTFYEAAGDRDSRFATLCGDAAVRDGQWFCAFVTWLRGEANMRSASLVAAAEGVKARLDHTKTMSLSPGPDAYTPEPLGWNRKIVDAVLQRPDEPGEFLAYWTEHYGRNLPMPVKRGVADATARLYNERSLLKYDTASHGWRFGDVIELTHPTPGASAPANQGDVFAYALHRRHGYAGQVPDRLMKVRANVALRKAAVDHPEAMLDTGALRDAGMTWEDTLSLVGSKIPKKDLWEALAPTMGYMALLRNLRNFDEAEISDDVIDIVAGRLADSAQVYRSHQFPYRFLSAYRAAPSLAWGRALEKALLASVWNVPALPGRWLVAVDTSASMTGTVSERSTVRHVDVGAMIGTVLAARATGGADLIGYANGSFVHRLKKGGSLLPQIEAFTNRVGEVGHGTETAAALHANYSGHAGVVVVTDGQAFRNSWRGSVSEAVPASVPLFGVDTTGYSKTSINTSVPNRFEVGGFSDKLFTMMGLLASGRSASWPWEA